MRTLEELINHDGPAIPLVRQWLAESSRQLLVLRKTTVPAVLLEVGAIVDAEDVNMWPTTPSKMPSCRRSWPLSTNF